MIRLAGILLPRNCCRVTGSINRPSSAVPGLPSAPASLSEKSPSNSALEGIVLFVGAENCLMSFHSMPPKKKNLSLIIGPPKLKPKLLYRNVGRSTTLLPARASPLGTITSGAFAVGSVVKRPRALLKKLLASS